MLVRPRSCTDCGVRANFPLQILLVCEGLDTIASVAINGKPVGMADNMFRRWQWDVSHVLVPGSNRIAVSFLNAPGAAAAAAAAYPYDVPTSDNETQQHGEPYRNFLRKGEMDGFDVSDRWASDEVLHEGVCVCICMYVCVCRATRLVK